MSLGNVPLCEYYCKTGMLYSKPKSFDDLLNYTINHEVFFTNYQKKVFNVLQIILTKKVKLMVIDSYNEGAITFAEKYKIPYIRFHFSPPITQCI